MFIRLHPSCTQRMKSCDFATCSWRTESWPAKLTLSPWVTYKYPEEQEDASSPSLDLGDVCVANKVKQRRQRKSDSHFWPRKPLKICIISALSSEFAEPLQALNCCCSPHSLTLCLHHFIISSWSIQLPVTSCLVTSFIILYLPVSILDGQPCYYTFVLFAY